MNIINPLIAVSLFSLTFFWGFGLYPVSTFAQNNASQPKPKYQYPQEIVNTYISSCRQRSIQEGLTEQQAKTVCQCTINRFQSQYSFEQFLKIYTQAQKTKESPDEFVDVGIDCATQLLN
ncbi:hypothetical protein PCC9214_03122 [Planktothrix tepida]|uniref:Uncharacterized protein n=2 Tax=Planktothrix TaxID=54304 RepID=A0A1J1LQ76_9CYAN|nr:MULTISPECIES: hypothetical protein [Planktothrix]CAD5950347.1 hypothetical protein NO713_02518 [Planktothrix pseudagardhii]CAD5959980.1 hypothetical protein PCC9214_03122 [Planktothrix tepida]CUR34675.1 conserved exported hypothetical protein [Planktothrix tepida PCC 9214]